MSLRKFKANIILYSGGTIVSRLSSFLLIPLYTHSLSVYDYGLLSTILVSSQLIITLIDFGIMPSIIRLSPEVIIEKNEGKFLGTAVLLNILIGIILSTFILLLNYQFYDILEIKAQFSTIFLFCSMSITQAIGLNLITYFRASDQNKLFTYYSIASTFSVLLLNIIALYFLKMGINGILLSNTLAYLFFTILILIKLNKKYSLQYDYRFVKRILKYGAPLVFTRSSDLLVATAGIYLLGIYSSLQTVGIYSFALKYCALLQVLLILPFQLTFEPYLFNNLNDANLKSNIKKIIDYFILIFLLFSISLIIITKDFITIIAPKEYFNAYFLIIYVLPIYAIQGLQHIFQSFIHINKKTYITGALSIIISILSLILNYFFIKEFQVNGLIAIKYFNETIFLLSLIYFSSEFLTDLKYKFNIILLSITSYILFFLILTKIIYLNNFIYYLISITVVVFISLMFYLFRLIDIASIKNLLRLRINTNK